jgi:hypothetical protein
MMWRMVEMVIEEQVEVVMADLSFWRWVRVLYIRGKAGCTISRRLVVERQSRTAGPEEASGTVRIGRSST